MPTPCARARASSSQSGRACSTNARHLARGRGHPARYQTAHRQSINRSSTDHPKVIQRSGGALGAAGASLTPPLLPPVFGAYTPSRPLPSPSIPNAPRPSACRVRSAPPRTPAATNVHLCTFRRGMPFLFAQRNSYTNVLSRCIPQHNVPLRTIPASLPTRYASNDNSSFRYWRIPHAWHTPCNMGGVPDAQSPRIATAVHSKNGGPS